MSRTTRRYPHGFARGERHYEEALARHQPGIHPGDFWRGLRFYDFRKAHVYHGRDGAIHLAVHWPSMKTPKGYCTHEDTWGLYRKRSAKFQTGRCRRLQGAQQVRAGLNDHFGDTVVPEDGDD